MLQANLDTAGLPLTRIYVDTTDQGLFDVASGNRITYFTGPTDLYNPQ